MIIINQLYKDNHTIEGVFYIFLQIVLTPVRVLVVTTNHLSPSPLSHLNNHGGGVFRKTFKTRIEMKTAINVMIILMAIFCLYCGIEASNELQAYNGVVGCAGWLLLLLINIKISK